MKISNRVFWAIVIGVVLVFLYIWPGVWRYKYYSGQTIDRLTQHRTYHRTHHRSYDGPHINWQLCGFLYTENIFKKMLDIAGILRDNVVLYSVSTEYQRYA